MGIIRGHPPLISLQVTEIFRETQGVLPTPRPRGVDTDTGVVHMEGLISEVGPLLGVPSYVGQETEDRRDRDEKDKIRDGMRGRGRLSVCGGFQCVSEVLDLGYGSFGRPGERRLSGFLSRPGVS